MKVYADLCRATVSWHRQYVCTEYVRYSCTLQWHDKSLRTPPYKIYLGLLWRINT